MEFPTLKTERLILREWQESDAARYSEIFNDRNVIQYTWIESCTPEKALELIAIFRNVFEKGNGGNWAVVDLKSSNIIGGIDFGCDKTHYKINLGCCFAPEAWGQGFAYEAVKEVIRYCFEEYPVMKINRIEAGTDPRNISSITLLDRLGFKREGLMHEYYFERGAFVDQLLFGLLRNNK